MDILEKLRIMQAIRNVNNSQTAKMLNSSKQNFSNKLKRNNFSIKEIQEIANVLDFDMEIIFTDRESGKKI